MFKGKLAAAVAVVSLALASSAFATKVGPGLGYVVFGDQNGPVYDLLAATTNGTFCSQGFAITFGTSGYSGGLIGMEETDKFIADNMDALATDIAMGEGEYVIHGRGTSVESGTTTSGLDFVKDLKIGDVVDLYINDEFFTSRENAKIVSIENCKLN